MAPGDLVQLEEPRVHVALEERPERVGPHLAPLLGRVDAVPRARQGEVLRIVEPARGRVLPDDLDEPLVPLPERRPDPDTVAVPDLFTIDSMCLTMYSGWSLKTSFAPSVRSAESGL